ncbi:HD domain-containing protein [Clostridium grantii]|uniref:HDIG domain-containing protein n=1 Tax=Clostridium grantii DSM 8605 TaxID=1121316 RepID=A0A1M5UTX4_9CLOT|nr:HD domain-containing protein [Clostridium grantii]SHH66268.1 HDIG domain-containing protein [Clostridium grantii DSM 8605]
MTEEDLLYFKDFFLSYVEKFRSNDETIQKNIMLKKHHTLRVLENISIISKNLQLDENSDLLAKTIAIFHDIGRFYQFEKYKTFSDAQSENHAELGIKVLESAEVLSRLSKEEKTIILKAVQYHNMFKIPSNEESKYILFCKLIRDADKIDIYKVLTDYYGELDLDLNPAIEHNLPNIEHYSPIIIDDILNSRNSNSKLLRTRYDMRLLTLTWIFDINYKISIDLIKNRDFINKTLKVLPTNEDMTKVKVALYSYMENF